MTGLPMARRKRTAPEKARLSPRRAMTGARPLIAVVLSVAALGCAARAPVGSPNQVPSAPVNDKSVLRVAATRAPTLKDGLWSAVGSPVTKGFTKWSVRTMSGRRMFRYYVDETHYYEDAFAVITLYKLGEGGAKFIAGDLVFFGADYQPFELPIALKEGTGPQIVLFYGRRDFEAVLASLTACTSGLEGSLVWMYMREMHGDDFAEEAVVGQILLDCPT